MRANKHETALSRDRLAWRGPHQIFFLCNYYSDYCILQLQVIARTVPTVIPTDVLDRSSGQAAVGELVSLKMHNATELQRPRLVHNTHVN